MIIKPEHIEILKHDLKQSMRDINIYGKILGKKTRVVSKIGKDCADRIVEALFAQMSAFDEESTDLLPKEERPTKQ